MPGAVPRTSTYALTGVTLPYLLQIANEGAEKAMLKDKTLKLGLNTYNGHVTCKAVAEAMNLDYVDANVLIA